LSHLAKAPFTQNTVWHHAQDEQGNIQRLVSMNSNSMDRWGSGVYNLLGEGDTWVPSQGAGLHAEQNLLRYADANNLDFEGFGSDPIKG
jgi:hypothetical protein